MPGEALPNVYCAGEANAATLNQRVIVRWSAGRFGSPLTFGRSVGAVMPTASEFETELESEGVKCSPVYMVQIPERSQLPRIEDSQPLLANWRPLPNGIW